MGDEKRTFKIRSGSLLIKTVQAIPTKLPDSFCVLEAELTNNSIPPGDKTAEEKFLQIGNLQKEMWLEAEGPEIGIAKKSILYLLKHGYRGRISFSAQYGWYEDYPDPIEYQFASLNIDGKILILSCDEKFPITLKVAFKNILPLYNARKKVLTR